MTREIEFGRVKERSCRDDRRMEKVEKIERKRERGSEHRYKNKRERERERTTKKTRTRRNPRVFFSYGWDNAWRANQIKNQTEIDENTKASFVNESLIEKSKAQNEDYIKRKIRAGIDQAGTVAILNSPTFDERKFAQYETQYAIEHEKKMIVINTEKMKDSNGQLGVKAPKPELCQKYHIPSCTYEPGKSRLKDLILRAIKPLRRLRREK